MKGEVGEFSLLVEDDAGDWHGAISIPSANHKAAEFQAASYRTAYDAKPFAELGSHAENSLFAWLDKSRPVTLIESFVNSRGSGAWRVGYRRTFNVKGRAGDLLFDRHLAADEACITSFGLTSDSLRNLFHWHDFGSEPTQTDNDPPGSLRVQNCFDLGGNVRMQATAIFEYNNFLQRPELKAVPIKFICTEKITILETRRLIHTVLTVSDFLAG